MNKMTKKEALEFAKGRLSQSFFDVNNYGKIFFCRRCHGCVLRDVVYYMYKEIGLAVEVFSADENQYGIYAYFVGTKEHAEALHEVFGGRLQKSDTSYFAATPEYEAWTLDVQLSQLPTDQEILDIMI